MIMDSQIDTPPRSPTRQQPIGTGRLEIPSDLTTRSPTKPGPYIPPSLRPASMGPAPKSPEKDNGKGKNWVTSPIKTNNFSPVKDNHSAKGSPIKSWERATEALEERVQRLNNVFHNMLAGSNLRLTAVEEYSEQSKSQVENINGEVANVSKRFEVLDVDVKVMKPRIDGLLSAIDMSFNKLAVLDQNVQELTSQSSQLASAIADMKTEQNTIMHNIETLGAVVEERQTDKSSPDAMKLETDSDKYALTKQMEAFNNQFQAVHGALDSIKKTIENNHFNVMASSFKLMPWSMAANNVDIIAFPVSGIALLHEAQKAAEAKKNAPEASNTIKAIGDGIENTGTTSDDTTTNHSSTNISIVASSSSDHDTAEQNTFANPATTSNTSNITIEPDRIVIPQSAPQLSTTTVPAQPSLPIFPTEPDTRRVHFEDDEHAHDPNSGSSSTAEVASTPLIATTTTSTTSPGCCNILRRVCKFIHKKTHIRRVADRFAMDEE